MRERPLAIAAFVILCSGLAVYQTLLIGNGTLELLAPEWLDRAFGNMMRHLVRGEFTVDRDVIAPESFTRNGETYTYFGIFPAFLRLLVSPVLDDANGGLARLSCIVAMVSFVGLQVRTLWLTHCSLAPAARSVALLAVTLAALCLSGPQIYLLASARIFHEPIFWSAAMGAAFNLIVLRVVLSQGIFTLRDLGFLATLSGLALNTRASVGVGLCLATTLIVVLVAWTARAAASAPRQPFGSARLPAAARSRSLLGTRVLTPLLILTFFAVIAGIVNYGRWDNPFRFADFHFYDYGSRRPIQMAAFLAHGDIDPGRIWISALYYATGIPYLLKSTPPFSAYLSDHFWGLEAPPLSGLIVNPLLIVLAGIGLHGVFWRPANLPGTSIVPLRLVLAAHAVIILLVCASMNAAMRYRMDFAPFVSLAAFAGYRELGKAIADRSWRRMVVRCALALCIIGIIGSHYFLVVHKVWANDVPMEVRLKLSPYVPLARSAFQ